MVRHIETYRDNKVRYMRDYRRDGEGLAPLMTKTLKLTARATWFMMKTLVKTAFKIPKLFSKITSASGPQPQRRKNPSPATAFPAP